MIVQYRGVCRAADVCVRPRGFCDSVRREQPSSRDHVCRLMFWSLKPPPSNRLWAEIPDMMAGKRESDLSVYTLRLCCVLTFILLSSVGNTEHRYFHSESDKDQTAIHSVILWKTHLQYQFASTGKPVYNPTPHVLITTSEWKAHEGLFYFDIFLKIWLKFAQDLNGNWLWVTLSWLTGTLQWRHLRFAYYA